LFFAAICAAILSVIDIGLFGVGGVGGSEVASTMAESS
jgi:hypothetical protein